MKQSWRLFEASRSGHRFQERYRRQQAREGGWRDPRRLFFVVGGLLIAVVSLAFGVLPGPGTLTFFLGLGMIAGEFYPVARLLDWGEVRLRRAARAVREVWADASPAGKAAIALVVLIVVAALAYGVYSLLFGGRG
jgi:hypothetical protein